MEARVAKLEAAVEHIQSDVADLKADLRQFKSEMHDDMSAIRAEARSDFRYLLSALVVGALGLAGLMAKGFGWLKF